MRPVPGTLGMSRITIGYFFKYNHCKNHVIKLLLEKFNLGLPGYWTQRQSSRISLSNGHNFWHRAFVLLIFCCKVVVGVACAGLHEQKSDIGQQIPAEYSRNQGGINWIQLSDMFV